MLPKLLGVGPELSTVIGIDPGLAHCGWGVLSQVAPQVGAIPSTALRLLDCGEIRTPSSLPLAERLGKLYREIQAIFVRYQPAFCAVEELYFNKNSSSGLPVAHARGVVLLCAGQHNVAVSEFSANRIKQAVTGYGKAQKSQVQEMVAFLLGLKSGSTWLLRRSDHAADALAAAICSVHQRGGPAGMSFDHLVGKALQDRENKCGS